MSLSNIPQIIKLIQYLIEKAREERFTIPINDNAKWTRTLEGDEYQFPYQVSVHVAGKNICFDLKTKGEPPFQRRFREDLIFCTQTNTIIEHKTFGADYDTSRTENPNVQFVGIENEINDERIALILDDMLESIKASYKQTIELADDLRRHCTGTYTQSVKLAQTLSALKKEHYKR